MKKRSLWIIAAVVILAVIGGFFVLRRLPMQSQSEEIRSAVVERRNLQVTVSASGRIDADAQVNLSFDVAGTIAEVAVDLGDEVQAGQPLAWLETTDLERAVAQAELGLQQAELRLQQLEQPPDEADVRRAQHAVDQAAAALDVAQINRSTVLSSTLLNESLEDAQEAYDDALERYESWLEEYEAGERVFWYVDRAEGWLDDARLALARVQHQVDLQSETSGNDVTQAQQAYQEAQDNLDELLEGVDPLDLELARLDVESAQIAVDKARSDLEKATLLAPFDGVVATVNVTAGESAPVGLTAISLLNPALYHIHVSVDEIDVARITVGLPVEVAVDALPGVAFTGAVERIGPAATPDEGAISYPVVIALDPTDAPLRADMSATAVVMVEELADQLLIPNWLVRVDDSTGQTYVYRQTPEGNTRVDVQLGVRYEGYSQVLGGLDEGDVLVLVREAFNGFFGPQ